MWYDLGLEFITEVVQIQESQRLVGRLPDGGAKCDCCSKVFSLPAFESHATTGGAGAGIGTTNHRDDDDDDDGQATASNFVLQDGKVLDGVHNSLTLRNNFINFLKYDPIIYDNLCSICHKREEGEEEAQLIMCDRCPSTFHPNCVGLGETEVADYKHDHHYCWVCPIILLRSLWRQ